MAASSNVYIHDDHVLKRPWTNWNDNLWAGSRLTMGKETADLVNIFLGIFIFFVEAAFWGYISLALFLLNHQRPERDGLHHQLQAVFRNFGSSLGTFITLAKFLLIWGWRICWRRTSFQALTAAICFAFFAVGMPFIIAKAMLDSQGVEVLIRNLANCGFWAAAFTNSSTTAAALLVNQSREAMSYVDLCYNQNTPSNACDFHLPTRRLPVLQVFPARCPFSVDACFNKNQFPAFKWQTDHLDSHVHFGINAPAADRMLLQRTTTCAPLDVDRFTAVTNGTLLAEQITGVYFGRTSSQNSTYRVSNYESVSKPAYHVDAVWSHGARNSTSSFTPVQELWQKDADLSIIFLNNQLIAIKGTDGPCSDPFFSATNKTMPLYKDYYQADRPITAVGCTDQYAFGNPRNGQWTQPSSASSDWIGITSDWNLSPGQKAALLSLQWSIFTSGGIEGVILGLGVDALLAKKSPGMFSDFQNPIPNDQWKKEVGYWFEIGLAKLQFGLIAIAVGPPNPALPDLQNALHTLTVGQEDLERTICTRQKVYSPDHKNYNAAGFIFLLVIGGIVGCVLPWLKHRLLRWLSRKEDLALRWNSLSTLQMQRMLIESAAGPGATAKWERLEDGVPRLNPRDASAGHLDIEHVDGDGIRRPKWSN
ncbi:hypothetical protein IF1G_10459 [Cordyceps javanica]|uniref:Uncharacterized protein n=1 Tax=Cordyceps javanica TaxID=43265 RepID=A0A545VLU4_9HYPO|nr:hypothetical protein IF1G_10459 [Cordyceps javanica]TQW02685.1 hypothetical protein IF2G_09852 [Cordyceps javanica]